ncbi:hypothetical protein [Thalassobellus sediminis]|uniref:hypothetical protein n=1 Tax=Thalassobellus sediminis TaxID=3367753 RepID=UPI00378E7399
MKTITKQLLAITLCFTLIFSMNLFAQKEAKRHDAFFRIYSADGKKIAIGHIKFINDSILGLKNGDKLIKLGIDDIGYLKTKHSAGHNVLVGAVPGASLGVIMGVSTADPDALVFSYTKGEGAAFFGGIGALGGAVIGGLTSLFKKTETYIINGDINKWKVFKEMIEKTRFR